MWQQNLFWPLNFIARCSLFTIIYGIKSIPLLTLSLRLTLPLDCGMTLILCQNAEARQFFFLFNSDTQVTDHNGVHSMRHVIECHTIVFVYANDTFENKTNDVLNSLWLPTIAIRTYTWAHTLTSEKNLLTHSVVCCYEYLLCAIILAEHFKMLNVSVINYI